MQDLTCLIGSEPVHIPRPNIMEENVVNIVSISGENHPSVRLPILTED